MVQEIDPRRIEVIDEATAAMYRAMTGVERLRVAFGMQEFAARMIGARVREAHPAWDDGQVAAEVSRALLRAHD